MPNNHVSVLVATAMIAAANDDDDSMSIDDEKSRTELDSHANMVVVGRHALIISNTGRTAEVSPFTPDYEALQKVPIVDAAIQYMCPYDDKLYILIVRNALSVPSMKHNLVPPFIVREAGVQVNSTPKIHTSDPTVNDHSIYFPDDDFRIPLSLWGVFSYFPTSKPTTQILEDCEDLFLLTPGGQWNPHSDAYAKNEENMLDWEGNMVEKRDRVQILLSDVEIDSAMASSATISKLETKIINEKMKDLEPLYGLRREERPPWQHVPPEVDDVASVLCSVSTILDPNEMCSRLCEKADVGRFKMSIGSTNVTNSEYLQVETVSETESTSDQEEDTSMGLSDDFFDTISDPLLAEIDLDEYMASAAHAKPRRNTTAEHLSKVWRIDLETARKTLDITSQNCGRTDNPELSRNYSTNDRMLRYKRINEYFFMDTFFSTKKAGKSSRGNTCCQLFVTDKGFVYVVPMKTKSEVMQAVKQFAKEVGAPDAIISDAAPEQKSQEMKKFLNEIGTTLRVLEEGTPWANKAELYIGLVKEAVRKDMKVSNCPLAFWDYCVERRARINNLTARNLFQLHGTNSHTSTTGDEGDISNLVQYQWYDWCYYREHKNSFPFNREVLGRVLGPAKGEGNEMAQWLLKANGNVVPRRTSRPLHIAELHSPTEAKKRETFDALIERRWGTSINPPPASPEPEDFEEYSDDDEEPRIIPEIDEPVDSTGKLLNQQPTYDQIISAKVQLQLGDEVSVGQVRRRALGPDGIVVGTYHDNPIMNSIVYEVEFPDGQVKEYAANVIAENMLSQIDEDGYSTTLMESIIDHMKDESTAVPKSDRYVITARGQRRPKKSTAGWKLLVKWKDGSETWVPLKDLKESHPIEVSEFAKARGIDDEPAFAWWVPYTLRKRDIIISAIKTRIRKTTHKYGIEIPNNIQHANKIDAANGNHYWRDALAKEMHNVGIAFEVLENDTSPPVGWKKVTGHLVFDVKMDFTRKARWVLDGHKTDNPIGSTYAGVVSRDSVRIAFTYAALNGLDVWAADIRNAFLQAPSSQKDYIICGPEFGLENVGKIALIRRALYGGKAAGRDFRNHLRACMRHLDFVSCPADPDVWMRPAKKSDGSEYYEYALIYTDDVLVVSENCERVLKDQIGRYFELKEESIGPPKLYLGGHVRKVELANGAKAWAFSSSQYVQSAVKNVEEYLTARGMKLPSKAETPIRTSYRPELDVSSELGPCDGAYYQSLIGILRWMVELGRVDICLETSMMSSHLALPREGHLAQVYHMFAYLKKYHNSEMVFDPSDPAIDESEFERQDWTSSEFGHVQKEELPGNMPEPRGLGFIMRAKVDADHAADTVTRRSRTGFLVYLNSAPIYWSSKKQNSVESSSFGSEFIAMKQCCEYLRGLRYKLRMMGIPCEGPAYIFGDNQSVLFNTSIPDSTLKKKSQSIAYHLIREGSARDEWRTAYVNTHENEADLLTKCLPSGPKRKGFIRNIIHHIFDPAAAAA
jgi:hypothetical protein